LTIAVVVVVWYIVIELFLKGFVMARGSRHRKGVVGKSRTPGVLYLTPRDWHKVTRPALGKVTRPALGALRRNIGRIAR